MVESELQIFEETTLERRSGAVLETKVVNVLETAIPEATRGEEPWYTKLCKSCTPSNCLGHQKLAHTHEGSQLRRVTRVCVTYRFKLSQESAIYCVYHVSCDEACENCCYQRRHVFWPDC